MKTLSTVFLCFLLVGCAGGGDSEPTQTVAPAVVPPVEPPPPVIPLTLAFHGTLVDGGTVNGTFSYDKDTPVVGTDVRGRSPNVTYRLRGWTLRVHQTSFDLQDFLFTSVPASTVTSQSEFCVGECMFDPAMMQRLFFTSSEGASVALVFLLPAGFNPALPQSVSEWGDFSVRHSEFRLVAADTHVWPMTSGTLTRPSEPVN